MLSAFYQKHGNKLLLVVLISLPIVTWFAETIPSNNDIETWLPETSESRTVYDEFRATFGADECVVIGYARSALNEAEVEALCSRFGGLKGITRCWSPARLSSLLTELEVNETDARARLNHLVRSSDNSFNALLLVFDNWGIQNRAEVVRNIHEQVRYSNIPPNVISMSGAPVIVTELDKLGNRDNNKTFFLITLAVCLLLLQFSIRNWPVSLAVVGLTVWGMEVTVALLNLCGVEMNFILSALPVLVMVFTLAVSIHLLHSFRDAWDSEDPLSEAILAIWKPAALATITTVIGLLSLSVSSIGPVRQFGVAASVGSVIALIAGLGILPAVLLRLNYVPEPLQPKTISTYRASWWLVNHARSVTLGVAAVVIVCGIGLPLLQAKIDPVDFLPDDSAVLADVRRIEDNLGSTDSLEIVVDFGLTDIAFFDRLEEAKRIETLVASHPDITQTMSLLSFMPAEALSGSMPPSSLIAQARRQHDDSSFVVDAERLWRISARLVPGASSRATEIVASIRTMTSDSTVATVQVTGLTPVLSTAQSEIFRGFWESFAMAFVLISAVMLIALRSIKAGLLAMVPNLTPICIVFGILGWTSIPVDIGTMMTASIALGLAVDGTFHFLFAHYRFARTTPDPLRCTHESLCRTGLPILQAAVISAVGMLALTLSNFKPTMKFGLLMFALLLTALVGDLVLLPAILSLRRKPGQTQVPDEEAPPSLPGPHFGKVAKRSKARA